MLNCFPSLHNSSSPLTTLLSSFHNALPCLQYTFTRRTSGHCLEVLTAVYSLSLCNMRRSLALPALSPTHFLSVSVAMASNISMDNRVTCYLRQSVRNSLCIPSYLSKTVATLVDKLCISRSSDKRSKRQTADEALTVWWSLLLALLCAVRSSRHLALYSRW